VVKSSVDQSVWRRAQTGHLENWVGFAEKRVGEAPERRRVWESILRAVHERAPIESGERVLDVGGGLDTVLDFLPRVRGFALDPLAPELAELGLSRTVGNVGGVFEHMPFRSASFDRVFLMNVLDHVQSPSRGIAEIARVLRPGGVLVLSVDTFSGRRYRARKLHKWWGRVRRARTKHPWVFSVADVQRIMRRAGLEPSGGEHVPLTKDRRTLLVGRRPS
jgi:SAM-dependent methyltransferase